MVFPAVAHKQDSGKNILLEISAELHILGQLFFFSFFFSHNILVFSTEEQETSFSEISIFVPQSDLLFGVKDWYSGGRLTWW